MILTKIKEIEMKTIKNIAIIGFVISTFVAGCSLNRGQDSRLKDKNDIGTGDDIDTGGLLLFVLACKPHSGGGYR